MLSSANLVRQLAEEFSRDKFQPIGISLDEKREALDELLRANKIDWPVHFDGKGWESPLARSLGINTLPTIWIFDRAGNLRTLNARDNSETVVRQLLQEH